MIRAILACDEKWGIGLAGALPWPHNPADLKWFKEQTINKTIVMGKSTWDSLPFKPLPNRHNIVVTSSKQRLPDGVEKLSGDIMRSRLATIQEDICIIGGAKLIESLLDMIDEFHLSQIRGQYGCDTFLPVSLIEENFTLTSSGRKNDVYIDVWSKL